VRALAFSTPTCVGIGEAAWGQRAGTLATVGLGSCIAVAIYDRYAKTGGLLHFQLPSATDPARALAEPFLFGVEGLVALTRVLRKLGCIPKRSAVAIAGGAQIVAAIADSQIGLLNTIAARTTLARLGYQAAREAVGGRTSRSLSLDLASGDVAMREAGGCR
jgi:chemotaxis protein CheD